jgi:hypothetical protein
MIARSTLTAAIATTVPPPTATVATAVALDGNDATPSAPAASSGFVHNSDRLFFREGVLNFDHCIARFCEIA